MKNMAVFGCDRAELNAGFLDLVAQEATGGGLPPPVLAGLRTIAPPARQRLAALPFALFGLGFEDDAEWARLLSPGVRDLYPAYVSREPLVERFTLLVLTTLRASARLAPHSISAWIGLPGAVRVRLADLEIGTLGIVGALAASRLRGGLAGREEWWLRLVDAAARNDERQLRLLAALGTQWAIRRCLGMEAPAVPARGYRR
jgi:hypothetical protein